MKKQLIGYGLAVVAILALIAALVPQMLSSVGGGSQQAQGAESAQGGQGAQNAASNATADPALTGRPACAGTTIAGIELGCLGGEEVPGEMSDAGPTVVNVWAWWCGPCRDELPIMAQFATDHPEYQVIGVHADPSAERGAAFLDDLGVDLPSFQDDSNAFAGGLGLPGVVPITVVIDHGELKAMFPKEFTSEQELEEAISQAVQQVAS